MAVAAVSLVQMAVFYERRNSPSARWSRWVATFSAVLFITSALAHRFGMVDTVPFFWLLGVVGSLAGLGLGLAASGFSRLWNYGDRGGRDSTRGAIVALIVLAPFLVSAYRVVAYPQLNDISTDPADPPELIAAAVQPGRIPEMNVIDPIRPDEAARQETAYPAVMGRRYDAPIDRVMESVQAVLATRNWKIIDAGRTNMAPDGALAGITIEATAWSFWLAWPADVAIRVIDEGDTSFVDMRSASRFGLHDMGDNAARITSFLEELDAHVAANAAVVPPAQ